MGQKYKICSFLLTAVKSLYALSWGEERSSAPSCFPRPHPSHLPRSFTASLFPLRLWTKPSRYFLSGVKRRIARYRLYLHVPSYPRCFCNKSLTWTGPTGGKWGCFSLGWSQGDGCGRARQGEESQGVKLRAAAHAMSHGWP